MIYQYFNMHKPVLDSRPQSSEKTHSERSTHTRGHAYLHMFPQAGNQQVSSLSALTIRICHLLKTGCYAFKVLIYIWFRTCALVYCIRVTVMFLHSHTQIRVVIVLWLRCVRHFLSLPMYPSSTKLSHHRWCRSMETEVKWTSHI